VAPDVTHSADLLPRRGVEDADGAHALALLVGGALADDERLPFRRKRDGDLELVVLALWPPRLSDDGHRLVDGAGRGVRDVDRRLVDLGTPVFEMSLDAAERDEVAFGRNGRGGDVVDRGSPFPRVDVEDREYAPTAVQGESDLAVAGKGDPVRALVVAKG